MSSFPMAETRRVSDAETLRYPTMTLATNSNTASCRSRELQLWFIRLALVTPLAFLMATGANGKDAHVSGLRVTSVTVRRSEPRTVELRVSLLNTTNTDLYIPLKGIREPTEIPNLTVLHLDGQQEWLTLGPFFDLPEETALKLRSGETYIALRRIWDPAFALPPGERVNGKLEKVGVSGKHMVRVGYYCGLKEWSAHLLDLKNLGRPGFPRAHIQYSDSAEFDIPPSK